MLYAAFFNNARTDMNRRYAGIGDFGARWALPGGLQRFSFSIPVKSRAEAYWRYQYDIGVHVVIYDDFVDMPVAEGDVWSGAYRDRRVHYVCQGDWARHFDEYETNVPAAATDYGTYISGTVLANHVLSGNLDTTNVGTTSINIDDSYILDEERGERPGDIIRDLIALGNSSNQAVDYFIKSRPFTLAALQYPEAILRARVATDSPSWRVRLRDLRPPSLVRDAFQMYNHTTVSFEPRTTLSANAAGDATTISVTSAADMAAEYEIEIYLDSGRWYRTTIESVSGTTVTIIDKMPGGGAAGTVASSGNPVRRTYPLKDTTAVQSALSQSNYWTRYIDLIHRNADSTQAAAIAQAHSALYAFPAATNEFVIGSRYIKDNSGMRWPLHRILIDPGIIQIDDLYPDLDLFTAGLEQARSFRVTAIDYDHTTRTARIIPDVDDQRLDVILQQLGAQVGQGISRQ